MIYNDQAMVQIAAYGLTNEAIAYGLLGEVIFQQH